MFPKRKWKFESLTTLLTCRRERCRCRIESIGIAAATTLTSNPALIISSRWPQEDFHKTEAFCLPGDCLGGLERDEGGLQDGLRRYHLQSWLCAEGQHSLLVFHFVLFPWEIFSPSVQAASKSDWEENSRAKSASKSGSKEQVRGNYFSAHHQNFIFY